MFHISTVIISTRSHSGQSSEVRGFEFCAEGLHELASVCASGRVVTADTFSARSKWDLKKLRWLAQYFPAGK